MRQRVGHQGHQFSEPLDANFSISVQKYFSPASLHSCCWRYWTAVSPSNFIMWCCDVFILLCNGRTPWVFSDSPNALSLLALASFSLLVVHLSMSVSEPAQGPSFFSSPPPLPSFTRPLHIHTAPHISHLLSTIAVCCSAGNAAVTSHSRFRRCFAYNRDELSRIRNVVRHVLW